ncbi:hypothetical protein SeMB42_g03678 [Synchytrium endobioticum]|uniref:Uncharacterized protein n=1 Tax=Synchytrium endobioticum TaxID=286115 RepID=A0A507D5A0_9FUNG|nr:hypothetical protein SeMB42_g03678 [Synchytrium endobioticum]
MGTADGCEDALLVSGLRTLYKNANSEGLDETKLKWLLEWLPIHVDPYDHGASSIEVTADSTIVKALEVEDWSPMTLGFGITEQTHLRSIFPLKHFMICLSCLPLACNTVVTMS